MGINILYVLLIDGISAMIAYEEDASKFILIRQMGVFNRLPFFIKDYLSQKI